MEISGQLCQFFRNHAPTSQQLWGSNGSTVPVLLAEFRARPISLTSSAINSCYPAFSEATRDVFLTQNGWFPHVFCPWNSFKTPLPYYHPKHLSLVGRAGAPGSPMKNDLPEFSHLITSQKDKVQIRCTGQLPHVDQSLKTSRFARKSWQKLPVVPCFMVNMMRNHRIFGEFFGIPQFWWLKSS